MHGIQDGWYPQHQKHFKVIWEGEKEGFHCQVVDYQSQGPWIIEYLIRTFIFRPGSPHPMISFDMERSNGFIWYCVQEPDRHVTLDSFENTTFGDYDNALEKWFDEWIKTAPQD